jgi:pimeloyl-ACP methyl ester carboxylesterase
MTRLGIDRGGRGPALVLLHPLGADRHVWAPVASLLASHRETFAVDLPGFGDSAPCSGEPTPLALAEAIDEGMRELGVTDYDVAGNSLGGWVALELGLSRRARSVTAIAPAGLWSRALPPRRSQARRAARAALPLLPLLSLYPSMRARALALFAAHPERIPPPEARRLVRAYATAPGFDAVNDAMRAGTFTGLSRMPVPTTLAWPEFDRLVGPPSTIPQGVRAEVLRGCGHLPMWDDPRQVADLLLRGSARDADAAAGETAVSGRRPNRLA